MTKKKKKTI